MKNETEHTCQFCFYECFNSRAYPCSMCICGEERKDMFMPKGRQNKRKTEPQTIIMVKDHGRKQALEMIDLCRELKTEQTEREDE